MSRVWDRLGLAFEDEEANVVFFPVPGFVFFDEEVVDSSVGREFYLRWKVDTYFLVKFDIFLILFDAL